MVAALVPFETIKAASCTLQGNTITSNCEFAPGTYYYNGTFAVDEFVTVTAGNQTTPGQVVIIADDFSINGTISADGMGNAGGAGPCHGQPPPGGADGNGGCHAGYGGRSPTFAATFRTYGSADEPVSLGSGGGDDNATGSNDGGRGGGAIKIQTYSSSTGTLSFGTLGAITANGSNAAGNQGGGGSGGSVWIDVGVLDVDWGFISANGGNGGTGTTTGGGGGGGGRVAIHYESTSGIFTQTRQAFGGNRGTTLSFGAQPGGAGTIFAWDRDDANGVLIVDNNNQFDSPFTAQSPGEDYTVKDFYLRNDAKYVIGATNTLAIASGGTLNGGSAAGRQPELWIHGVFDAPSEAMTISAIDIHQYGTVGTVRYLNYDNGVYSIDTSSALFSAGRGNRLEGLTVSGTSGRTFFSASSTAQLFVDTLTVKSGAIVTHASNTTTAAGIQHQLSISATTSIEVQSGGSIDTTRKGYNITEGPGQGVDGSSAAAGGGAYGGDGGRGCVNAGCVAGGTGYGSITQPTDPGSGGGNDTISAVGNLGRGGGIIKLTAGSGAGTITIDGTVASEGGDAQGATLDRDGGGSGGSVWIDLPSGTLAGTGTVSVDGGDGYFQASNSGSGGGGGGRIAIYYSGSHSLTLRARGGLNTGTTTPGQNGGSGSIYEKAAADTNGMLTYDNNNNARESAFSRIPAATSLTVKGLKVTKDSHLIIPTGSTLAIEAGGTFTGGGTLTNQPSLWIYGTFVAPSEAWTLAGVDVNQYGTIGTVRYLNYDNGVYSIDTSSALFSAGRGNRLESLTVSGTSSQTYFSASSTGVFYVDTLVVKSGGVVTSASNSTTALGVQHRLHISATTSVEIESGGSVNLTGKGYSAGQGPGAGGTGFTAAGGAHGGNGGRQNATPVSGGTAYGSATSPDTLGSGGGTGTAGRGGEGGGSVRIVTPTLNINGSVVSDGGSNFATNQGGGAGGSIWIDVTDLTGSGIITAKGSGTAGVSNGASGGGGRIALYTVNDTSTLTVEAFGGPIPLAYDAGGAGTIFRKDDSQTYGDLYVVNAFADDTLTPQVNGLSQTYDNVTISTGARYEIGSGETLTVNPGGTFVTAAPNGRRPRLIIDGTFNPPSASQTISDIDVFQNATLGVVTSLSINDSNYFVNTAGIQFTAGPGNRLDALTLGNNAIFSTSSTAVLFLDTLTMNSGSLLVHASNTSVQSHQLDVSATTSITMNSGSLIDLQARGFSWLNGTGKAPSGCPSGGAAHGGAGGRSTTSAGGAAYGSATAPYTIGSGGTDDTCVGGSAGPAGGGAVKFSVNAGGTITINGIIDVRGMSDPGSGYEGNGASGGSIWINAPGATVTGTGSLIARGGNGDNTSSAGAAGGGRVAVYYSGAAPSFTYDLRGGLGLNSGGAGTLYLKEDGQTYGDLIIDNEDQPRGTNTPQLETSATYDSLTIRQGGDFRVPGGITTSLPAAGDCSALIGGGGAIVGKLTIDGTFNMPNASCSISALSVYHNGTMGVATSLTFANAQYNVYAAGAQWSAGAGNRLGDLTLNGGATLSTSSTATLYLDTLTVNSGGIAKHGFNTGVRENVLDVSATTSITIASGGQIPLDGAGYSGQMGPGKGTSGNGGTGGGHGGQGGGSGLAPSAALGAVYDSETQPIDFGSGSGDRSATFGDGSVPGGGAVKLAVNAGGTITVDGTISANGNTAAVNEAAGAAGGSIWLDAPNGTVTGTGIVRANGGNGGALSSNGGGGGGRIAIYYSGTAPTFTIQAFGGAGGTGTGSSAGLNGGAGTIFRKSAAQTNGSLEIDNNEKFTYSYTSQSASNTSITFDDIIIEKGGRYHVPSGRTTTMASSGSCSTVTAGGTTFNGALTINGTFNAPNATCSLTGLDIEQFGTLGTATSMTVASGTYTVYTAGAAWPAGPGNRLEMLTLGSGATLSTSSTAPFFIDTLTVNSGGALTHEKNAMTSAASNTLYVSATTSIIVNSGATVNANAKGYEKSEGPGQGTDSATPNGGAHGGSGGPGTSSATNTSTYGNYAYPSDSGSGGGDDTDSTAGSGSQGGGAIRLVTPVNGTLTIATNILANGVAGNAVDDGGGAGGSIWLEGGAVTISGNLTASGGAGASAGGGCGGGGRIAVHYNTLNYASGTATASTGCAGARAGTTGSVYFTQFGELPEPPVNGFTRILPSVLEVGQNVVISASATDDVGVTKIEIYLDGTGPANLVKTCTFSPAVTPATCQYEAGSLSAGSHSVTVVSEDGDTLTDTDTTNFTVAGRTAQNRLELSTYGKGETSTFTISFVLTGASTGTLTVTFPAGFTVNSAATGGSPCLSGFGFTATTLTATKTGCAGTVTMTGASLTNPSVAGAYVVTFTNDNGSGVIVIVDDDDFDITASVDPVLTFNVGTQTGTCDGTFTGSGGTLSLGGLTTSAVATSDVGGVAHICARLSTNAPGGAVVTVLSQNAALTSVANPGDQVPSSTATLSAGTSGYGLCVGSSGGDTGRDSTDPVGAAPAASGPFGGSCSTSSHQVGGLTTSPQAVWSVSGPTQNAFARLFVKAAISSSVPGRNDYADVLTFIVTARY